MLDLSLLYTAPLHDCSPANAQGIHCGSLQGPALIRRGQEVKEMQLRPYLCS